jgi:hypothetical protein
MNLVDNIYDKTLFKNEEAKDANREYIVRKLIKILDKQISVQQRILEI